MVTIKGYPNYSIDKSGNIYNINGHKLSYYISHNGYLNVTLYNDGVNKKFRVHRLVAQHFLKHDANRLFVNHKDGNKLNNKVDNLEWCTPKENTKHAIESGLRVSKKGQEHKLSKKIRATYKDGNVQYFFGTRDIERKLGVNRKYICRVLNGKRNHHKGVKYEYA